MIVLFVGDIVGASGRKALREYLPGIISKYNVDFVIANGENAAGGFGITRSMADQIFAAGVHLITSGNHIWDKKEVLGFIDNEPRLLRPANYPDGAPGVGFGVFVTPTGSKLAVLNLAGRVFMPAIDCPFQYAMKNMSRMLKETKTLIIDFHAEATSEKIAFARMLDGRVTAIIGTHTHVQTADERLLQGGTAYISDAGMTGPVESVIGTEPDIVIEKFLTQLPRRFEVAKGARRLDGVILDINETTGKALGIQRISISKVIDAY